MGLLPRKCVKPPIMDPKAGQGLGAQKPGCGELTDRLGDQL